MSEITRGTMSAIVRVGADLAKQVIQVRIPLIADTHSKLIADSVPGDRGHPGKGA